MYPRVRYLPVLLASAVILSGCTTATVDGSSEISMEEFCALNDSCRKDSQIQLKTDSGPFEVTLPVYWPVVDDDVISLLPGESVFIEALLDSGRLTNLKLVQTIASPERTMSLEFTQHDNGGMMLIVENPFDAIVKMNIDMFDFEGNAHKTSSCPIFRQAAIVESWPHPILELSLSNFRVISESDGLSCEY